MMQLYTAQHRTERFGPTQLFAVLYLDVGIQVADNTECIDKR